MSKQITKIEKRLKQITKQNNPIDNINNNKVNDDKLQDYLITLQKYYRKGSFPNNMMRNNNQNLEGMKIGNWYSIGIQPMNLFGYSHKPWDKGYITKILDWDPDKVEFVWIERTEFNTENELWGAGKLNTYPYNNVSYGYNNYNRYLNNTNPELLSYIPFGIELEVKSKYRAALYFDILCSNCEDGDPENCFEEVEFDGQWYGCGDEIRDPDIDRDDINEKWEKYRIKSFQFLAELNTSFGAYGTKKTPIWIAKEDGTVDAEYVSHPMTYRAFKMGMAINKKLFNSFSKYSKYASGWSDGSVGIHIHIDKDILSTYQTYALLNIHYDNPSLISDIAGRNVEKRGWQYLQPVDSLAKIAIDKGGMPTRAGIAFTNKTIELRYFRSNLKSNAIEKNIEWVQAMYHFVRTLTYQDMARDNAHNIKYFLLFIKAYRNRYKNLYFHLMQYGYYKPDKQEKEILAMLHLTEKDIQKIRNNNDYLNDPYIHELIKTYQENKTDREVE